MKIKAYYFSPTGGTLQVLREFVEPLGMAQVPVARVEEPCAWQPR